MSKNVLVCKTDRAKVDVLVTSKSKATPCLEWSKTTGRHSPIVGVGGDPTASTSVALHPAPMERHKPGINFSTQLPRVVSYIPVTNRPLSEVHNCDVLSTHTRSTACPTSMRPAYHPTADARGWSAGSSPKSAAGSPRATAAAKEGSTAEEKPTDTQERSPKGGTPVKHSQRIHVLYDFDVSMNAVRPASRSVNMKSMKGREASPTPARRSSLHTAKSPSASMSSRHRRAIGGDFGKAPGREPQPIVTYPSRDIVWKAVDKHIKGSSFHSSESSREKQDSMGWYLTNDPVVPLCTRWKGTAVRPWQDSAYSAVRTRPPSVAAPRAGSSTPSAVIKAATAQLSMVRSTLLRHSREGERKKKERLAQYASDVRLGDRDLSPSYQHAYNASV